MNVPKGNDCPGNSRKVRAEITGSDGLWLLAVGHSFERQGSVDSRSLGTKSRKPRFRSFLPIGVWSLVLELDRHAHFNAYRQSLFSTGLPRLGGLDHLHQLFIHFTGIPVDHLDIADRTRLLHDKARGDVLVQFLAGGAISPSL